MAFKMLMCFKKKNNNNKSTGTELYITLNIFSLIKGAEKSAVC